jgi:hypothetical protein
MRISILNNFAGDKDKEVNTSTDEGRAQAAKLMDELLKSGSAIFLEREIDGETKTYRGTGYDPATDKVIVKTDDQKINDPEVEAVPKNKGRKGRPLGPYRKRGQISSSSGRMVSVAPVSGG